MDKSVCGVHTAGENDYIYIDVTILENCWALSTKGDILSNNRNTHICASDNIQEYTWQQYFYISKLKTSNVYQQ